MADQLQLRGGTTTEHNTFTGASKEVTVDTTKKTAVVHDGATTGGNPLMREDGANSALILGSQSTPSLKFVGDTNTGIYSPGADQVAVATNGTGRLFVDSSGNVGVGTSSPSQLLELKGANVQLIINGTSTTDCGIEFQNNGTSFGEIKIDTSSQNLDISQTQSGANITFSTDTSATERMRITSDGSVGIGTSSVTNSANVDIQLDTVPATDTYAKLQLRSGNYGYIIKGGLKQGAGGQLHFDLNNNGSVSTKMVLDTGGRLGIGTTSPAEAFTLGAGNAQITSGQLTVGVTSSSGLQFINDGTFGTLNSIPLILRTASAERARIDTSGRLLVGTSSWSGGYTGQVIEGNSSDGTGPGVLYLARGTESPANGQYLGELNFSNPTGDKGASIMSMADGNWAANDYPGRLVFSTTADGASSPTERMRINNDGTPGLLTAQYGLHVTTAETAGASIFLFSGRYGSSTMYGGTQSIVIYTNGDVKNTNNSYGAISDVKLKENIVDANSQWDDLKALQVRNYNFKEGQTHTQIGLVAQEVELVSPGLVSESPDRDEDGNDLGTVTKSVNYSVLYMKAVKALQEAMERIETLEAKVAALESA